MKMLNINGVKYGPIESFEGFTLPAGFDGIATRYFEDLLILYQTSNVEKQGRLRLLAHYLINYATSDNEIQDYNRDMAHSCVAQIMGEGEFIKGEFVYNVETAARWQVKEGAI